MIIAASVAVVVIALLYLLVIRQSDLPYVEPLSPTAHLDERKAAVFENIRDANFEFLMGKLSQDDYQQTKTDLQKELAEVNAEIQAVLVSAGGALPVSPKTSPAKQKSVLKSETANKPVSTVMAPAPEDSAVENVFNCPHCGATFAQAMKFCGACGKPMDGGAQ